MARRGAGLLKAGTTQIRGWAAAQRHAEDLRTTAGRYHRSSHAPTSPKRMAGTRGLQPGAWRQSSRPGATPPRQLPPAAAESLSRTASLARATMAPQEPADELGLGLCQQTKADRGALGLASKKAPVAPPVVVGECPGQSPTEPLTDPSDRRWPLPGSKSSALRAGRGATPTCWK